MPINPFPVGKAAANAASLTVATAVMVGLQQKQSIINEVIEGKIALLEAARRFRAAHRAASIFMEKATGVPDHTCEAEETCRAVIGWVNLTLCDRPEQADRISEKLESELCEVLQSGQHAWSPR